MNHLIFKNQLEFEGKLIYDFKIEKSLFYVFYLPFENDDFFYKNENIIFKDSSSIDDDKENYLFKNYYGDLLIMDYFHSIESKNNLEKVKNIHVLYDTKINNLSIVGLKCLSILNKTLNFEIIIIDLDGFSFQSQFVIFEFIKLISKVFENKTFISYWQSKQFNIKIVEKSNVFRDYFEFYDDEFIKKTRNFMVSTFIIPDGSDM